MSKRKCSIPKGFELWTHSGFGLPYNYILIDKSKGHCVWCDKDLGQLTSTMYPIEGIMAEVLLPVAHRVIR